MLLHFLTHPGVIESIVVLSFALVTEPFFEPDTPWYDHPITLASKAIEKEKGSGLISQTSVVSISLGGQA